MINLDIHMLTNFQYTTHVRVFPIVVSISSTNTIRIAKKIDVLEQFLNRKDNENIFFGFSQNVFGFPHESFDLMPNKPHFILLNLFEDEEDYNEFKNGKYEIAVKVVVFLEDGGFKEIVLEKRVELDIN